METVLTGSLGYFSAAELLAFLCGRESRGTLEVECEGGRARVLFENDRVLWAESSDAKDAIETVLDVLTWTTGRFTLLDAAVVPETVAPVVVELSDLLKEAKRREELASSYPDETLFRVVDDPALQERISLNADQFKLLFRVGRGRAFRELVSELDLPRIELAQRIRALAELGLITVTAAPPVVVAAEEAHLEKTTLVPKKTKSRKRTLIGSLTSVDTPDSIFPLLDVHCTIGRTADNAIRLTDGSVSSKHARIVRAPEGFTIEDLGSRNGTFVNGEPLGEPRLLADGDLLRLGKALLTFNIAREAKGVEQTRPDVRREG